LLPTNPQIERITLRSIAGQVLEQLNLERGLGYTIKLLALDPGKAIREFLFEDRGRMIRPLPFLLLTVGVATYLSLQFLPLNQDMIARLHSDPGWNDTPDWLKPVVEMLIVGLQKYFNLMYMASLPFMTVSTFIIFNPYRLNFAEHLVLNIYLFCMQTLIYILTFPILASLNFLALLQTVFFTIYTVYFFKKVFNLSWRQGIIRSLLVYLLGQLFAGIALGIAIGITALIYKFNLL
jgi:hypothetical protein